jgi:lambda family phage minor tail protein L
MTLPSSIAQEAQKLSTDKLVRLYSIDATALGGGIFNFVSSIDDSIAIDNIDFVDTLVTVTTINAHLLDTGNAVRISNASPELFNGDFTATVIDAHTFTYNLTSIPPVAASGAYLIATRLASLTKFGGVTYTPINIEVSGFEWNGQGSQPNPTLLISNVNKVLISSIITLKNLVGAKFTRTRTFRKHLDDGDDPDGDMFFPRDIYRVHRKVKQNKIFCEFELATAVDQEGIQIPGRTCLKRTCTQRYRIWDAQLNSFDYTNATCPYTGGSLFNQNNQAVSDAALDRCSKQLSGCILRFGTAPLPTTAIPGIGGQ